MSEKPNRVDWEEYPVVLELRFKTEKARENFLEGFLDGWGENAPLQTNWDWPNNSIDKMSIEVEDEDAEE